jgi:hypothetical protein
MAGKIYALRNGGELTELTPSQYANEDIFQSLIEKHPDILAGDQINPDSPRKWLLVSREMSVPAEPYGGAQWVNLRAGKVWFIFVVDSIPAQLQVIIEFLNRQMIDTEVLGLEI